MIQVNRPPGTEPAALKDPGREGDRERIHVQNYYAQPANQNRGYKQYSAYKHDEVEDTLNKLFHKKCAYCERTYASNQPMDVEHYRPKNEVFIRGQAVNPGYWWLASDWENLLPSCIDCNRRREQELIGLPARKMGKGVLFPIKSEKKRAKAPGQEKRETRRLLNPCLDDPAEHLEFLANGNVRGKTRKGKTSIRVLGLRRKSLVEVRARHEQHIKNLLNIAVGLAEEIEKEEAGGNLAQAALLRPHLVKAIAALEAYRQPNQEFLAMVNAILDPILAQIRVATVQPIQVGASAGP